MRVLLGVLLVGLCAIQTWHRAHDWHADPALWSAATQTAPNLPRPALNLAAAYARIGQFEDSALWTQRAIAIMHTTPARHGWIARFLCRQINQLEVLMDEPPPFAWECAF